MISFYKVTLIEKLTTSFPECSSILISALSTYVFLTINRNWRKLSKDSWLSILLKYSKNNKMDREGSDMLKVEVIDA